MHLVYHFKVTQVAVLVRCAVSGFATGCPLSPNGRVGKPGADREVRPTWLSKNIKLPPTFLWEGAFTDRMSRADLT